MLSSFERKGVAGETNSHILARKDKALREPASSILERKSKGAMD